MVALNLKTTGKFNYYFDEKFFKNKPLKPIFCPRNMLIILTLVVGSLFTSLYFLRISTRDIVELHELKWSIAAFMELNNINRLKGEEIDLLAKEIRDAAERFEIDPMLVLAIITVESAFKKNAVSVAGARGLMQLMPSTAKTIARDLGIKYSNIGALCDIRTNVMIGTYYLSKLALRYNRNMKLYLTAYNYGPAKIDRLLRKKDIIPDNYYFKVMRIYKELSF